MNGTTREAIKISASIIGLALIIALALRQGTPPAAPKINLPPLYWGDVGPKLVSSGMIDVAKLEEATGGLSEEERAILKGDYQGEIKIGEAESYFLLNTFWALGLAQKSQVLSQGPMGNYEDVAYLASTGGWTVGKDGPGDYYLNKYEILNLTPEQEKLVYGVASNTYRPCCDNPTLFPDCNHGAALLGALELAASQGFNEEQLYALALKLNSLWFPGEYQGIAKKFPDLSPKEVLGAKYSSYSGWQKNVAVQVQGGTSCAI
ncbi:MAG: hypothetical protein HYW38_01990 [Candidatus Colwellbacteria bacterium]|nr:hypothetical protein [Candidatus Colwellbacteria bacterium]